MTFSVLEFESDGEGEFVVVFSCSRSGGGVVVGYPVEGEGGSGVEGKGYGEV